MVFIYLKQPFSLARVHLWAFCCHEVYIESPLFALNRRKKNNPHHKKYFKNRLRFVQTIIRQHAHSPSKVHCEPINRRTRVEKIFETDAAQHHGESLFLFLWSPRPAYGVLFIFWRLSIIIEQPGFCLLFWRQCLAVPTHTSIDK